MVPPDDDLCKGGSVTLVLLLQDDESKLRQGLSEATKETHDVSDLLCSETGCRVEMHEAKKSSKVKKLQAKKGGFENELFKKNKLWALLVSFRKLCSLPSQLRVHSGAFFIYQ